MKKLSLLALVLVLVVSLASCGYSLKKDDMSDYATFDKAKFEAALKALKYCIKDKRFYL